MKIIFRIKNLWIWYVWYVIWYGMFQFIVVILHFATRIFPHLADGSCITLVPPFAYNLVVPQSLHAAWYGKITNAHFAHFLPKTYSHSLLWGACRFFFFFLKKSSILPVSPPARYVNVIYRNTIQKAEKNPSAFIIGFNINICITKKGFNVKDKELGRCRLMRFLWSSDLLRLRADLLFDVPFQITLQTPALWAVSFSNHTYTQIKMVGSEPVGNQQSYC